MRKAILNAMVTLLLTSCATTSTRNPASEVHVLGAPVTLNLDGLPGPDGFAIRVFVTQPNSAKGAPIKQGALEILMFDGVVNSDSLAVTAPTQTWKFSRADLDRAAEKTALGHGYQFAPRWNVSPKHSHITVVARYVPPQGSPIYSSPSVINSPSK